jgi:hypothetical protein
VLLFILNKYWNELLFFFLLIASCVKENGQNHTAVFRFDGGNQLKFDLSVSLSTYGSAALVGLAAFSVS